MDFKQLNNDLVALVIKRNLLASIHYSDDAYDQVEEDLHDTEDEFLEKYDSYLEEVLQAVHDEYCPESDVLLPIAYLAKKYIEKTDAAGNVIYGVGPNEGLLVESELHPNRSVRLILIPSPIRIIMTVDNANARVVWEAK